MAVAAFFEVWGKAAVVVGRQKQVPVAKKIDAARRFRDRFVIKAPEVGAMIHPKAEVRW